jgi:hypothetical protein
MEIKDSLSRFKRDKSPNLRREKEKEKLPAALKEKFSSFNRFTRSPPSDKHSEPQHSPPDYKSPESRHRSLSRPEKLVKKEKKDRKSKDLTTEEAKQIEVVEVRTKRSSSQSVVPKTRVNRADSSSSTSSNSSIPRVQPFILKKTPASTINSCEQEPFYPKSQSRELTLLEHQTLLSQMQQNLLMLQKENEETLGEFSALLQEKQTLMQHLKIIQEANQALRERHHAEREAKEALQKRVAALEEDLKALRLNREEFTSIIREREQLREENEILRARLGISEKIKSGSSSFGSSSSGDAKLTGDVPYEEPPPPFKKPTSSTSPDDKPEHRSKLSDLISVFQNPKRVSISADIGKVHTTTVSKPKSSNSSNLNLPADEKPPKKGYFDINQVFSNSKNFVSPPTSENGKNSSENGKNSSPEVVRSRSRSQRASITDMEGIFTPPSDMTPEMLKLKVSQRKSHTTLPPLMREDRDKYDNLFLATDLNNDGLIDEFEMQSVFAHAMLPAEMIAKIRSLSDIDGDGKLDRQEFRIAMHIINSCLKGFEIPSQVPQDLILDSQ